MGAAQAARSYRVVCALIASTGTPPRRGTKTARHVRLSTSALTRAIDTGSASCGCGWCATPARHLDPLQPEIGNKAPETNGRESFSTYESSKTCRRVCGAARASA